jgi:hypothetical protein
MRSNAGRYSASPRPKYRAGTIAASLFDCTDQGLFVFAVTHLEDMLLELRRRYYASDFAS